MDRPFDSDLMEAAEAAAMDDGLDAPNAFDEGDAGDGFDEDTLSADAGEGADEFGDGDAFSADSDLGEDLGSDMAGEGIDDMAVWNAFEEEVADGLDAADTDEFLGRLLGGLGRAAGVVSRGLGGAAGIADRAGNLAQTVGRVAQGVGRAAGAVSPVAMAAARMARVLGAPRAAGVLGNVGQLAQGVGRVAQRTQGLAGSVGQMAGGAQGLFSQLSQLIGQGDEFDAFDAMIDLYTEDGVDEALPAAIGLAARAAARGLGFRNVAQLSQAGRRALVRGIAAAARELMHSRSPQAIQSLPVLARTAGRVAQRRVPASPQHAVQALRRGLPQTARRVAQNPRIAQRLAHSGRRPISRPTGIGRGVPLSARPSLSPSSRAPRTYRFSGPVTLTITPR